MKYQIVKTITILLITGLFTGSVFAKDNVQVVTDDLIEAVISIDLVSLNVLLSEGADIDTLDAEGNTPLMIASKIGNPRMLRIILVHNPDVDAVNNYGETALMIAAENGQFAVVQQLLEKGANIHAKNNDGLTAVDVANRFGHRQVINILNRSSEEILSR